MSNAPFTIKVPGKLMIAGEFAVLKPHYTLLTMAVDRFVYATVNEVEESTVTLEDFDLFDIPWKYTNQKLQIASDDSRFNFVQQAMSVTFGYLVEQGIQPGSFSLRIKSELDDESGKKYGLGSSAAVVTAVVTAILEQELQSIPSKDLIFRLSSIAHVLTQGNGSGADIAASTYGGILQYKSFQAEWLLEAYNQSESISDLVQLEWTYHTVKPIEIPKELSIVIGWTGSPASTASLVTEILKLEKTNEQQFANFLYTSEAAVAMFLQGVKDNNLATILQSVRMNREALSVVGKQAGVDIETKKLRQLCDIAAEHHGAGKSSGAGGGDCGIAFLQDKLQVKPLMKAWEAEGIKPLSIQPYPFGAGKV